MSTKKPDTAAKPAAVRVYETREIDSLKQNALQSEVFGDLPDAELDRLRVSIKKQGLTYPIEIQSDGTILDGHQRVRAFKLLGRKKIRCWVRTDLEEKGAKACDDRFVEANLERRQLTKLQIARCCKRLKGNLRYAAFEGSTLRDFLAIKFGCSGRNLDRWFAVLDAPRLVQELCEAGKIKLVDAGKVGRLPAEQQAKLIGRLEKPRAGESPKEIVKSFLNSSLPKQKGILQASKDRKQIANQLMSRVNWIVDTVKPQLSGRGVSNRQVRVPKLREAIKILQGLVDRSTP